MSTLQISTEKFCTTPGIDTHSLVFEQLLSFNFTITFAFFIMKKKHIFAFLKTSLMTDSIAGNKKINTIGKCK